MDFLNKYSHPKNKRFGSFKKALETAESRNLKIIVETGTSRGKKKFLFFSKYNWKDGMSTLIFCDYAKHINGRLFSCDINSQNIKFYKFEIFYNCNLIRYLRTRFGPILRRCGELVHQILTNAFIFVSMDFGFGQEEG